MNSKVLERIKDGIDVVSFMGKKYPIRYSAKHAQHITDNYKDVNHGVNFAEIVAILKDSLVLSTHSKKWVSLNRHRKKVYETYFYLEKDRIDVVTSFRSNKQELIKIFESYES